MCGIAGFFSPSGSCLAEEAHYRQVLASMAQVQRHRGPDGTGAWLGSHMGLAHSRLAIIDLAGGAQPMVKSQAGQDVAISYNGELYNTHALRRELLGCGRSFQSSSDTEVILEGYLEYGLEFIRKMNGIFSLAIADTARNRLILVRDRAGVKPLFYTLRENGTVVFASELQGIFAFPDIPKQVDKAGLNEIFSLGPARSCGCGVFKNMNEVLPGHMLLCSLEGVRQTAYWKLTSSPHTESYSQTIEHTAFLVSDSIRRQMVSDVPICTFLSGGLDSSLVSAVCAAELKKQGQQLATYSFDFVNNDKYFQSSSFQPSQDRPYAAQMARFLHSDHHYLECDNAAQLRRLTHSVKAHDLPAMGDIDSSLLQFCSLVAGHHKVVLTGECADEIFGGYPWFHKKECFESHTFPWSMDLSARKLLLKDDFIQYLDMDAYVCEAYERSIAQTPRCPLDSPTEARRREISWLNLNWFMQTLLNRMDRTSMYCGLEARVPFADHRIIEYLWNVPWDMKARGGVVKNLLRQSARGLLPDEVLFRRKSPYPKTYDKGYEALLGAELRRVLDDSSSPILEFIDKKKTEQFLTAPSDYGKPWYGQLMAGPQMISYVLQVNDWLKIYSVQVL